MDIEVAINEIKYAKSFGTSGIVPRWKAIDTVLNYIEELENKLKTQTENYLSAMEDINWFCGKRTGKTVETALILRKEILKLPEGRTYGIRRCKNNIICVIPEEVTLNSKVRDKIEELNKKRKYCSSDEMREYHHQIEVLKEILGE